MPDFVAGEIVTANKMNQIPKGLLGYAFRTSNITGLSGGPVDLPDLSVQVTVRPGHVIRVVGYVRNWSGPTQGEEANLIVRRGDDTLGIKRVIAAKNGVAEGGAVETLIPTPFAGIHTYKLSFLQVTGTTDWTVVASATAPAYILVEDIGADPNG